MHGKVQTRNIKQQLMSMFGWSRFGLAWLITAYFLSHNTIQSTSRALFILPAEQAQSVWDLLSEP